MKRKQAFLHCAIMLSLLAGLTGCKDDSAAVSALQELTGQLSDQVSELNQELTATTETLQTCMKDVAETKGKAVVISTSDATEEAPTLDGEANVTSLEALKGKLNETLEKQKAALSDLKAKAEQCAKDLEAAQEEAKAAAEAEAAAKADAAAAAAKKDAARKTRKPTAVREAEKTGAPTKGTRSRY